MFIALAWAGAGGVAWAANPPSAELLRKQANNLYFTAEPVVLQATIKNYPAGKGDAQIVVRNTEGDEVAKKSIPIELNTQGLTPIVFDLGKMPVGYYEASVRTSLTGSNGQSTVATATGNFGVIERQNRTAKEVREGNYAFGLKWWGGVKGKEDALEAMRESGFQWTRIGMGEPEPATAATMEGKYEINSVIKVERFPVELYDVEKYGPVEEWEKKFGKGTWTLKTLPRKAEYQKFLAEKLAAIPRDQNVFEIWNEAWDKMSPEDFAQLCQWIAEVILKDRPDAIIGPNLKGNTSEYEFDARVIKAGGMKGMKMVALHPYAEAEDRQWLRDYVAWLKKETGTDMQIYVTECGSHSTPEGPAKRSETEQARITVRHGIILYAEGVKAILPHWLGQQEQVRTYIEHWFGFVRKNEEVKPVWVAFANAARLVDGRKYVGDLWYGPRVGAMVFDKEGEYTLVLWTLREEGLSEDKTAKKTIEIEPGVQTLRQISMMGTEVTRTTEGGKLAVEVSEAPVYLVGISPDLAKQASKDLRADRFPPPEKPPRAIREAGKLKKPLTFDGDFTDWEGACELSMRNPKVAGDDCSGFGYIAWDDEFLYVGVSMRDNEMLNAQPRAKLYLKDSMELWVSTEPRESGSGYGPKDKQFFLTPTSGEGKPILAKLTNVEGGVMEDIPGSKFRGGKTALGWAVEAAIPWATFPDGFRPKPGAKIALNMRVNDADTSHERWKIDPEDASHAGGFNSFDPSTWPIVVLKP